MKSDENKETVLNPVSDENRQNRREFFNGLGKWSMIVVAAVSILRESVSQIQPDVDGTGRPEWKPPDRSFDRLAKKKHHQHVDVGTGHLDTPHQNVPHVDYRIQPGGKQPESSGGTKRSFE